MDNVVDLEVDKIKSLKVYGFKGSIIQTKKSGVKEKLTNRIFFNLII